MTRRNYGGGSGVILDVCRKHGVFLDRGELTGVVDFLEKGGWERLKKRERERLEEEVAALEAKKHAASPSARLSGYRQLSGSGKGRRLGCRPLRIWRPHPLDRLPSAKPFR